MRYKNYPVLTDQKDTQLGPLDYNKKTYFSLIGYTFNKKPSYPTDRPLYQCPNQVNDESTILTNRPQRYTKVFHKDTHIITIIKVNRPPCHLLDQYTD